MKNLNLILLGAVALTVTACGKPGVDVDNISDPNRHGGVVATQVYGPAIIKEGQFMAEEKSSPWSSWWFPNNDDFLFAQRGTRLSPLQRYDEYVRRTRGFNPGAAADEETRYNPSMSDAGDGLCNAWSAAAIMEPEPKAARTVSGVTFDVIDQKALLIKSYELLEGKMIFGKPYRDDGFDDRQDLYPEQLHRLLQVYLFDKRQPIVVDTDSSSEVWNTPVSAAIVEIRRDQGDEHVMHVLARLWQILPVKDPDQLNFVGQRGFWQMYSYDLYGNPRGDGSFEVVYGKWTDTMDGPIPVNSVRFHPDFVSAMPAAKKLGSRNSKIDPEIVMEILTK